MACRGTTRPYLRCAEWVETARVKSLVRLVVVATCLFVATVSAPGLVVAASPNDIPQLTQQLTDYTGTLGPDADRINAALAQLYARTGVHLYVLFVNTTGDTKLGDYAVAVGQRSSLAPRDALLVVAIDDQTDLISLRPDLVPDVSQSALDRVRTNTLEAGLATGKYGDAVVDTADQLADVFTPPSGAPTQGSSDAVSTDAVSTDVPASGDTSAAPDPAPVIGGGTPSVLTIAALLVLVAGVVLIVARSMRRRPS